MPSPLAHETAKQLAELHAEHYRQRSSVQRAIERAKGAAARPWLPCLFFGALLVWIALHVIAAVRGIRADLDPSWLQSAVGFIALIMTSLILAGQRQDDELAEERSQLTLHMIAILDQKLSASPRVRGEATDVEDALHALRDAHRDVEGD